MKKLLFTLLLMAIGGTNQLNAQQELSLQCNMSVDDVLRQDQPFNMDDVIGETAMILVGKLIDNLKVAYEYINSEEKEGLDQIKLTVEELLEEAKRIELNLQMFEEDFKIINGYLISE